MAKGQKDNVRSKWRKEVRPILHSEWLNVRNEHQSVNRRSKMWEETWVTCDQMVQAQATKQPYLPERVRFGDQSLFLCLVPEHAMWIHLPSLRRTSHHADIIVVFLLLLIIILVLLHHHDLLSDDSVCFRFDLEEFISADGGEIVMSR